jgi:hypothetical protein
MSSSYTTPATDTALTGAPENRALVSMLDSKHAYWSKYHDSWDMLDLLYRGGPAILENAARFLRKRTKELSEVYAARLVAFDYNNILGTALGWYQSKLFAQDPSIEILLKGNNDPAALPDSVKRPYTDFLQNADRSGTTFIDIFRLVFQNLLVFKGAYVCVDLPTSAGAKNRAEQRASGGLDPYLMVYDPRSVINWDVDEFGNLLWAVIRIQAFKHEFLGDGLTIDRWYYYDRQEYRIYERTKTNPKENSSSPLLFAASGEVVSTSAEQTAELVASGPHSMSECNRVPVRYFTIPEGLWLASRAYLPSMAHLNIENSYQWAVHMANLPVPVITGDSSFSQTISETSYITLDKEAKFEWTEPKGTSFKISAELLEAKREEIYRSMFLMAQGRSSSASASSQSGYSKELDMTPSKDVLAAFGDIVRVGAQHVLEDVAEVRGDEKVEFDVRGFNFEINPALQEAETAEIMISLDIPSDTLNKEMQKRVAHAYLSDANRAVIQQVDDEIDAAPTRDEIAAQQAEQQKLSMDRALNRSVSSLGQSAENAA